LVISSVSAGDGGVYICTASDGGGRLSEYRARVVIQGGAQPVDVGPSVGPPTAAISPEYRTIGQGETIEIVCVTTGSPRVTWTKVGEDMTSPSLRVSGNTLTISNSQVSDRGMYLCSVENDAGSNRAAAVVEVEPREPPTLEIFPERLQTVSTGGSVLFQCRARTGIPSPTITWSRVDRRPFGPNVEILSGGVIRMTQVTGAEEGEYKCTGENVAGRVEAVATLTIHEVPTIQMTPQGSVTVKLGNPLSIRCDVSGDPPPSIAWSKTGRNIRTLGITSPIFQIDRVSKDDEGTYSCIATNEAGEMEERLQVLVTDDDYSQAPYIPEDPRGGQYPGQNEGIKYVVEVGNNVEITADILGNMAPGILTTWSRGDGREINARHYQRGNTLYIINAQYDDAGIYVCRGVDRRGNTLFNYNANLVIAATPRIRLEPEHQIVRPGDSPSIRCEVTRGDQPVNIQWSRRNNNKTSLPRSVSQQGNVLQFQSIAVSDEGRYVCRASNRAGHSEAVAEVIVMADAPNVLEPQLLSSSQGATVDLPCRLSADTDLTWTREGGRIPESASQLNNMLRIENVQVEDSGKYVCTGGGRVQYVTLMVERMMAKPDKPRIEIVPSQENPQPGDTLDVTCNVTGAEVGDQVSWSRTGFAELGQDIVSRGNMIRFNKLSRDQEGLYRCTVTSRNGSPYAYYNLSLAGRDG